MKYYVLIGMMICVSTYTIQINQESRCACNQIILSSECSNLPGCVYNSTSFSCQSIQSCPFYLNQRNCLELSQICQWNVYYEECNPFGGCNSIQINSVNDFKDCRYSNLNCLAYNGVNCQSIHSSKFSTSCIDYPETYCTENVGIDGVCIWESNTCQPITSCEQIIKQSQCQFLNQAKGYACQYINGVCTQITNCNVFTTQATCIHYFPNLSSETMILCEWKASSQSCENAQNTLYLNETNCLISTGYNNRWISNNDSSHGICVSCQSQLSHLQIVYQEQCLCSQYRLQTECNLDYCSWNQALSICQDIECSAVTLSSLCATMSQCYWDYQTGQCTTFLYCAELPTKINAYACAAQSVQCPAFQNGVCQGAEVLQYCSEFTVYNDLIYPEGCQNNYGRDGYCIDINGLCLPLQNCAQLKDSNFCRSWKNLCEWNESLQLCQQLTCSSYNNNPSKCLYVISGFQEVQYQICQYNSTTSICENAQSTNFLTAQNCSTNTASTYRWTQLTPTKGMCVSCQLPSVWTINQCSCFQYVTVQDCQNSEYCIVDPSDQQCIQKPCSQIYNQIACASLNNCYWNSTQGCTTFNSCSDLNANNLIECLTQNASCKGFSYTTNKCSTYPQQACSSYSQSECSNVIGFDGICYINGTECSSIQTCQGLPQNICNKIPLACYWNQQQEICQSMNCQKYQTKQYCKFYLEQPNSSDIIICLWNQQLNQCNVAQDVMNQLTNQNCKINTDGTYRWIPTQNNKGYCVKCQQQIILKNQCPCRYIFTQQNCYQAQECQWNQQSQICQSKECNQILIKSVCITSTSYCAWNIQNQQCINRQQINCNQLNGQTQQQCLQQSQNCLGTNGTTCMTNLRSCAYFTYEKQCFESFGTDGVCLWDNINQTCIGISECSQLPKYLCNIKSYACYYSENKCQTLTCETLYQNTGICTQVITLTKNNKIQTCQFVAYQCVPNTDIYQLNEEQCYFQTYGFARWLPLSFVTSGICISCSNNLMPIMNVNRCRCNQFLTQLDCQGPKNQCVWWENSCNQQNNPNNCFNLNDPYNCAEALDCFWNFNESSCQLNDLNCNQILGKSSAMCLASSVLCKGSNGTNCTVQPTNNCDTYSKQQCLGMIGIDGVCFYDQNTGCQGLSNCSQITNLYECEAFFKNACILQNNQCQSTQCSNYTTPASCTYIIEYLSTGQILMCSWDAQTEKCINLKSQKNKNFSNCATSTAFTYRWVPLSQDNITEGYCFICNNKVSYAPGQCACNQIFLGLECLQNPNCFWNGYNCSNAACSSISTQYYCSQNIRCAWSMSEEVCQPFTSCSDLAGISAAECLSYSTNCAAVTNTKLHNNKYICTVQTATECQGSNSFECEIIILKSAVCIWDNQTVQPSCVKISQCSQLNTQQQCQSFQKTCYWYQYSEIQCQETFCGGQFCTYYFKGFGNLSQNIVQCQLIDSSACLPTSSSIISQSSMQNCYRETFNMYRWSSSDPENGYCVSCAQNTNLETVQSLCTCSQLTKNECISYPRCNYNEEQCQYSICQDQVSQEICQSYNGCFWTGSQCQSYEDCSQIFNPTSPNDCIQAWLKCPVYNSTTKTCSALQRCVDQPTQEACNGLNQAVVIQYCFWNPTTYYCETINNCGQINDIYQCGLQLNRCQWSVIFNSCIPQTCNSFTSQAKCLYVYTSYQSGDIAVCQWDSTMNICRSAPQSSIALLTEDTCYSNTGFNYHFEGGSCVKCFQVILITQIILIQFLQ